MVSQLLSSQPQTSAQEDEPKVDRVIANQCSMDPGIGADTAASRRDAVVPVQVQGDPGLLSVPKHQRQTWLTAANAHSVSIVHSLRHVFHHDSNVHKYSAIY